MIRRTKKRCGGSEDLAALQAAVVVQPRSGRKKRAEPGSELSLAVRKGARRDPDKQYLQAANDEILRLQESGELDSSIKPLGNPPVYHILQDPEHCKLDPRGQKRVVRKRVLQQKKTNKQPATSDGMDPHPPEDATIRQSVSPWEQPSTIPHPPNTFPRQISHNDFTTYPNAPPLAFVCAHIIYHFSADRGHFNAREHHADTAQDCF